ncbi:LysR family transcriptional regulator [Kocuria coralli]|uniref:LysR family transcriptional regulator n=1 Tax=Kocuria coralli TaxID=1461025 RepID=A0A5J5KVJ4_9MICC|nr:LysR family transcriptional regulator [Kocuria coralli]KAA9393709.1 LysR family transcriptional regulator [Kocuria coralli]
MFDPRKLAVLVAVVEHESITAAAEELMFTASAVSQQLRKLEQEAGQPLFRRRPRGVIPTEAGYLLATHARKVLRQLHAAQSDMEELARGERGTLKIGTFPSLAASFLPRVLDTYRAQFPAIKLSVHSTIFDALLEELERGQSHLCFLWDYPWKRFGSTGIRSEEIFQEPSVVLVSDSHPLARAHDVGMADLRDEPWVSRANDHPVVEVLDRAAAEAGFRPDITMYANDYQEAQAMVSVGIGIAMVPMSAVALQHPKVRILSLRDTLPERRVLLAQREERSSTPAEMAFRRLVLDLARQPEISPPGLPA